MGGGTPCVIINNLIKVDGPVPLGLAIKEGCDGPGVQKNNVVHLRNSTARMPRDVPICVICVGDFEEPSEVIQQFVRR